MLRLLSAFCAVMCLVGCSSIPNVEYNYYFAKSDTVLSVAQAVTCDASKSNLIIVTTASPAATAYSADIAHGPQRINIRAIEGNFRTFVDSDAQFGFYDDGRLKSINQKTTGQGEAAIKSAVSLATTVAPFLGAGPPAKQTPCEIVDKWGGTGKAPDNSKPASVNLSYSAEFDTTRVLGKSFKLKPTPASQQLYDEFKNSSPPAKLPPIEVSIGHANELGGRATFLPDNYPVDGAYLEDDGYTAYNGYLGDGIVGLKLQRTASVEVNISSAHRLIWKGNVIVPLHRTYTLPIPAAALFGQQTFTLQLSEAGAIQSIDYGKTSGASGALNAAGSIATGTAPESAANKAADIKAQADLIAQTQRLLRCHTHPATCT
jgi:hypothetical protein